MPTAKNTLPNNTQSIFEKLAALPGYGKFKTHNAMRWFREKIHAVGGVTPQELLEDKKRSSPLTTPELLGKMFFFTYDAKYKETLPYWDAFPLVLPIETYDNGFLGINLHYLRIPQRQALFDNLLDFATNTKYNNNTKLKLSYELLNGVAKYKAFEPCIHRYLWTHIRSRFVKINAPEWKIALYLPVAQFQKKSQEYVWRQSDKKIKGKK